MKNNKKLFILSLALVLVGCGGGSTSNPTSEETPSSNAPTSEEVSSEAVSYFNTFKETYDAIGKNYYAVDYLFTIYENDDGSTEPSAVVNETVVTDKGVVNMASKSGLALANEGANAYRFGIDLAAEENAPEKMFLPSYNPANFYYYGFNADQPSVVKMNEGFYDFLYSVPSSSEIQELSDTFYSQVGYTKLPKFNTMFVEGTDADGNITFETTNLIFAMQMLEFSSFGRMEGFSDEYNVSAYNNFIYTLETFGESGFKTIVTMFEDDGFYALDIKVYLSYFSEEYPYIERTLVPLSVLQDYQLEQYDLFSYIVPEDFYTTGPGEEPQESIDAREILKAELENLMCWNYTVEFTGGSDLLGGQSFTGKYLSDKCFSSSGQGNTYSYYYVPVNESQPDVSKGGIYGYEESTGVSEEFEMVNTKKYVDQLEGELKQLGYPYEIAEDGVTISYSNGQAENTMNVSDSIEGIYNENFGLMYLLDEEFNAEYKEAYDGLNYWEVNYGSDWIDQFYYNERTGEFLLSNYYLKGAFLGCCVLFFNMNESLTVTFLPGTTAEETPIVTADYYVGEHIYFGVATFTNVGTTKASYEFGTYVNEKYGFGFEVEEQPAA